MESRQSRMNKYYDNDVLEESTNISSRTNKNKKLYKEVSKLEIEDFDLNSNASVIGTNTDNINLDEIKDILNKKYREGARKKSFGDTEEINLPKINLDETREYDLNSILNKAKESKENNYEEERLKKIRNSQYDILRNLDIINKDDEIEEEDLDQIAEKKMSVKAEIGSEKTKEELVDLIDTISAKELIKEEEDLVVTGEMDPLDILSDLRGDDDSTKVMGMLVHELEEAEKENKRSFNEDTRGIHTDIEEQDDSSEEDEEEEDTEEIEITKIDLDNIKKNKNVELKEKEEKKLYDSFIGKTTTFSQNDFDDFDDLKKDMGFTKVIVKILLFIIVILFIAGILFILKKQGLF